MSALKSPAPVRRRESGPRRSVRALAGYFGRGVGVFRRSADHVEATAFVWRELVRLLEAEGISTWSSLRAWLRSGGPSTPRRRRVWPMPREVRLSLPDAPGVYRMLRTSGDVLYVDAGAARDLVLAEGAFADAALQLARPGEATRIVHALDVAQPRLKVSGSGDYPGFVGPVETAGDGVAHRLSGVAIVETGPAVGNEPTWWREALIDMAGPGAAYSPFSETVNLVLFLHELTVGS